jgi:mono/diheme cytochrome c family protein
MKTARCLPLAILMVAAGVLAVSGSASAQQGTDPETRVASNSAPAPAVAAQPAPAKQEDEEAVRLEGEKRFHANCGRCHQAPHKLPPRMMATIVRHMRVRATITDEDMRVILQYMTQ